jgi:hypothetical protein
MLGSPRWSYAPPFCDQYDRYVFTFNYSVDLEIYVQFMWSTRWRSWLRRWATSRKVTGSTPDGVIRIFHWQSFRPHYGPGVDSASNRNEYQEYFLGIKAAGE